MGWTCLCNRTQPLSDFQPSRAPTCSGQGNSSRVLSPELRVLATGFASYFTQPFGSDWGSHCTWKFSPIKQWGCSVSSASKTRVCFLCGMWGFRIIWEFLGYCSGPKQIVKTGRETVEASLGPLSLPFFSSFPQEDRAVPGKAWFSIFHSLSVPWPPFLSCSCCFSIWDLGHCSLSLSSQVCPEMKGFELL